MKKILFIVSSNGEEKTGLKLFQDYPYGKTDKVEWEVVVANPQASCLGVRFIDQDLDQSFKKNGHSYEEKCANILEKKIQNFDEIYEIRTGNKITSAYWTDIAFIEGKSKEVADMCRYIKAEFIFIKKHGENSIFSLNKKIVRLHYPKTYDNWADFETILDDFERIIHQDKHESSKTFFKEEIYINKSRQDNLGFKFENLKEISNEDKKILKLNLKEKYIPYIYNYLQEDLWCIFSKT